MPAVHMIGFLGGTFDPVHYGHLNSASEIKQRLQLQELRLLPCADPVHREPPVANVEQRLTMLRLAVEEYPQLQIDDSELKRGGKSYSFDTLSRMRYQYPEYRLCLVMGIDAFCYFTQWRQWRKLLELTHIVLIRRPGYSLDDKSAESRLLKRCQVETVSDFHKRPAGGILLLDIKTYPISATDIRRRLAAQQSVDDLLPNAVLTWINTQHLYRTCKT